MGCNERMEVFAEERRDATRGPVSSLSKKKKKKKLGLFPRRAVSSRRERDDVFVFGSQANEAAHANVFVSLIRLVSQS